MSELGKSAGTGRSSQNLGLIIPLAITSLVMLIGMSFYQVAKYMLLPGLSLIRSNIITFSTTVATIAAYFVLRQRQDLLPQALRENAERRKREEEIRILNGALYGDRQMIKLVFLNLLANAIKFTGPRSHAVVEKRIRRGEKGGEVKRFLRTPEKIAMANT